MKLKETKEFHWQVCWLTAEELKEKYPLTSKKIKIKTTVYPDKEKENEYVHRWKI